MSRNYQRLKLSQELLFYNFNIIKKMLLVKLTKISNKRLLLTINLRHWHNYTLEKKSKKILDLVRLFGASDSWGIFPFAQGC